MPDVPHPHGFEFFRPSSTDVQCPELDTQRICRLALREPHEIVLQAWLYVGQPSWRPLAATRRPLSTLTVVFVDPHLLPLRTFRFRELSFVSYLPWVSVCYGENTGVQEQLVYRYAEVIVEEFDLQVASAFSPRIVEAPPDA